MLSITRKKSTTTTTRMADQVLSSTLFPGITDQPSIDETDQAKKKDPLASQVWRMYSQAKDNLPNGSRLENLTWRMMAMTLKKDVDNVTLATSEPMDSDPELLENTTSSKSSPMTINRTTTTTNCINIPTNFNENDASHNEHSSFLYGNTPAYASPTSSSTFFFGNDPPSMGTISFEDMFGAYYDPTFAGQHGEVSAPPTSNTSHYSPSPSTSSVEDEYFSSSTTPTPTTSTSSRVPQNGITQCANCSTKTTPLWRRDPTGNALCNACGLFLKLHGVVRPLSLKTDVIKKRNRSNAQLKKDHASLSSSLPSSSTNIPVRTAQTINKRQRRSIQQEPNLSCSLPVDPSLNYFGTSLPNITTTTMPSASSLFPSSPPPGLVHSSSNSSLASLNQFTPHNGGDVYSMLENIGVQLNNLPPELLPLIASAANYQAMATAKPSPDYNPFNPQNNYF
ncbi:hypothetical protein INT47_001457 [Mucor saturninus]|uniref:GATA-type domain-containing protein n=1 Tax=Mucor saturninus TaxID=64648 RepID=A0A8H7QZ99_9FUNG|nr:hypothetical protein INT47_001457 [Mucor saturninus]